MRGSYRIYQKEQLQEAIKESSFDCSPKKLQQLANKYKIPLTTLRDHVQQSNLKTKSGPNPYLSIKEEECLVLWIKEMGYNGIKLSVEDVQNKAKQIYEMRIKEAKENNINYSTPKFSRKWFRLFKKRHNLSFKKGEKLDNNKKKINKEDVLTFFNNLQNVCEENNIPTTRIYNADETGISLCPTLPKMLAKKGDNLIVCTTEKKKQITLLVTICSNGKLLTPLLIYKGKTVSNEQLEKIPNNWLFSATDNAFINGNVFLDWIKKIGKDINVSKENPALLILDSHRTRENTYALEWAKNNGMHILCLPSGATHLMQPLDVSLFKPFKTKYTEYIYKMNEENGTIKVYSGVTNWWEVLPHVKKALEECFTEEKIKEAFKSCGINPFDAQKIIQKLEKKYQPPQLSDDLLSKIFNTTIIPISKPTSIQKNRVKISNKVVTKDDIIQSLNEKKNNKNKKQGSKKRKITEITDSQLSEENTLQINKEAKIGKEIISTEPTLDDIMLEKFERRYSEGYDLRRPEDDIYWNWVAKTKQKVTDAPLHHPIAEIEVAKTLDSLSSFSVF